MFSTTYMNAETAKVRESHVRHRNLWVELWVEKKRLSTPLALLRFYLFAPDPFPHEFSRTIIRTTKLNSFQVPVSGQLQALALWWSVTLHRMLSAKSEARIAMLWIIKISYTCNINDLGISSAGDVSLRFLP